MSRKSVVGIDVGGTFTDLFFSSDGTTVDRVLKVPSTPDDTSRGLVNALAAAAIEPGDVDLIVHGTTIATNAVIERTNGGLVPLQQLGGCAANIVRSGPAAGVMAAARLAAEAGFDNVITGDMGGTSYDVAVVVGGRPRVAEETQLDFRIPLRLPMIDVHTIGAGGGSIASLDRGGILQVGPRSAGAVPGPACFGRGGTEPTVTDVNAVLARINPDNPIGLKHLARLDVGAARAAVGRLGAAVSLGVEETAEAILAVVNQRMAGRTRLLSVEHGHDPRDFVLVAFGAAGPLRGAAIMRDVGVRTMLIPPHPGVLCALGCAIADQRYNYSQTVERRLDAMAPGKLRRIFAQQRAAGELQFAAGAPQHDLVAEHAAQMSYAGQIHTLRVAVQLEWDMDRLATAFHDVYRAEYGNTLDAIPVMVVSLKTTVRTRPRLAVRSQPATLEHRDAVPAGHRPVYFAGWRDTPVYDRTGLRPGHRFDGPAILEQPDTTCVVEPGMTARVGAFGNVLVEMAS